MRLFFGAPVHAAWPPAFPPGRLLPEESRHLTLAFLGEAPLPDLANLVLPSMPIAPAGMCLKWTPLAHAAAADISWLTGGENALALQKALGNKDTRPYYPHITVAREPFDKKAWEGTPCQIPFFLTAIHLYESLGHSTYRSLWSLPLLPPIDEIDHTADIAFTLRALTLHDLFLHAQLALAFHFPPLLIFLRKSTPPSLDDLIIELNALIADADEAGGCPFKAVSFHGALKTTDHLEWRMIVDV